MKHQKDFPLGIRISFHKIIEQYRKQLEVETSNISREYLEKVLDYISSFPALTRGIEDIEELLKFKDPIRILMKDLFPEILSDNQIKAISVPFHNIIFNSTRKFREILACAGDDFSLSMRNINEDLDYIYGCILILNSYYKYDIDFSRPLYYDIPDKNGITRHYRIDLNLDFVELEPGEGQREITDKDVDLLIQNIEDVQLWKEKFPPNSWIFRGFTIISLTDVTIDDAISDLKTTLLQRNTSGQEEMEKFEEIFKSIYKIPNLRVGFTMYNEQDSTFERMMGNRAPSFLLGEEKEIDCRAGLDEEAYKRLVVEHNYFSIPNVDQYEEKASTNLLSKSLKAKEVKSAIIAPIAKGDLLLGVLELVSFQKNVLNSVNATKLEDILPFIVTAVERSKTEFENRVKAVIQSECTSIHPSVLWIFEKEARKFIRDLDEDGLASFKDITFPDVYPLYGEIDIVASSEARNEAIQKDILDQLELIRKIVCEAEEVEKLNIYEQVKFRINEFVDELSENLNASSAVSYTHLRAHETP